MLSERYHPTNRRDHYFLKRDKEKAENMVPLLLKRTKK